MWQQENIGWQIHTLHVYCAFEQTIPASSSLGLSSPAMDTSEILHKFIFCFCMTSKHKLHPVDSSTMQRIIMIIKSGTPNQQWSMCSEISRKVFTSFSRRSILWLCKWACCTCKERMRNVLCFFIYYREMFIYQFNIILNDF